VALAPVCVEKFQRAADASANLVALKKVDSWMQGRLRREERLATVPGSKSTEQVSAVAKACALLLGSV